MDRGVLEAMLRDGLSQRQMSERAGKSPTSIRYWLEKHDLSTSYVRPKAMDRELLVAMLAEGLSTRQMSARVGKSQTNIRHWLTKHQLNQSPSQVKEWSEAEFRDACLNAVSVAEVLDRIGVSKYAGNYRRANELARQLRLSLPNGNANGGGKRRRGTANNLSDEEIARRFVRRTTPGGNKSYKRWMVSRLGIAMACAECNTGPVWNGKPLVLELDHVDGDSFNYELQNLRLLCPNCHAQQPTTNRKKKRPEFELAA